MIIGLYILLMSAGEDNLQFSWLVFVKHFIYIDTLYILVIYQLRNATSESYTNKDVFGIYYC